MPAPALPIPWDDQARRGASQERTASRAITGSSRTTTVSPRE